MADDIEDLESLYSEHFGRTPVNTPAASQDIDNDDDNDYDNDDDDDDDDDDGQVDVDQVIRSYMEYNAEDNSSSDEDDGIGQANTRVGLLLPNDDPDICKIRDYVANGCGCRSNCIAQQKEHEIYTHILDLREMTKNEKDMYIMGSLIENDRGATKRGGKRLRSRHTFMFSGKKICKKIFMLIFDVGKKSLKNIMSHMKENGAIPRQHGNLGKKPSHSLTFDEIKSAVQYISNYADEVGLYQPAAPRGRDNVPPIYLPADTTKKNVHEQYISSNSRDRRLKYSTFCSVWNQCLPHIRIAKPRDDVCALCEKLRKCIMDSVTEEEKLESTNRMQEHIRAAQTERQTYNECIKKARDSVDMCIDGKFVHYTFDFSQSVSIPHHSRQMGPLYFLTLRKIQIFGFRIDGEPKQLNFLIDENEAIGKDGTKLHGPDAVISMIDHALENHGCGEVSCTIHADNCGGQNKNQFVLGYFMWRVMTGQHKNITYQMQIPGHARCLIDGGFALIKKLFRRTDCDTIEQLQEVVNNSSSTNSSVRYPTWQWREWKNFLSQYFKPLKGIRKYQVFSFHCDQPGVVTVKTSSSATVEDKINILRENGLHFDTHTKPDIRQAGGLSSEREQYLFRSVRPYVRPAYQNFTCPNPDTM